MRKNLFVRLWRDVRAHTVRDMLILVASLMCVVAAVGILWLSSLKLPDLSSFDNRKIAESTKIYDRTGQVLLYDLNQGIKRTVVSSDQISPFIKDATVSIEDENFYHHHGIVISSIIRAALADILSGH
ncbi:MAG: transglycosylase domain-containing protein, partial [Patescibacteria group bacterium]|nr:transglycosylase domain-containing protein [Patescibacteria group bacterium]